MCTYIYIYIYIYICIYLFVYGKAGCQRTVCADHTPKRAAQPNPHARGECMQSLRNPDTSRRLRQVGAKFAPSYKSDSRRQVAVSRSEPRTGRTATCATAGAGNSPRLQVLGSAPGSL